MVDDHYFTLIKYSNQLPMQRHLSGVHNVHVWMPCPNINVLDAHVYCCEADPENFRNRSKLEIKHRFDVGTEGLNPVHAR